MPALLPSPTPVIGSTALLGCGPKAQNSLVVVSDGKQGPEVGGTVRESEDVADLAASKNRPAWRSGGGPEFPTMHYRVPAGSEGLFEHVRAVEG